MKPVNKAGIIENLTKILILYPMHLLQVNLSAF